MIKAILTDIEGTTTAIGFVTAELFPYAHARLVDFVRDHMTDPEVQAVLQETAKLADLDADDQTASVQQLLRWSAEDKKITPLKTLQGLLWRAGYEKGELRGHIYPDAVLGLQQWHAAGIALYVYSSGSVAAQQLLFGHSIAGDLRPLFSGYFDTRIGGKREAASYRKISAEMAIDPAMILFLSDVGEELAAAHAAGMQVIGLDRAQQQAKQNFRWVKSFGEIDPFNLCR